MKGHTDTTDPQRPKLEVSAEAQTRATQRDADSTVSQRFANLTSLLQQVAERRAHVSASSVPAVKLPTDTSLLGLLAKPNPADISAPGAAAAFVGNTKVASSLPTARSTQQAPIAQFRQTTLAALDRHLPRPNDMLVTGPTARPDAPPIDTFAEEQQLRATLGRILAADLRRHGFTLDGEV